MLVAFMGWNGMDGVVDRVDKSDGVNALVRGMLEARESGKAFIINGDAKYVDEVAQQISALKKQGEELKGKFQDQADKALADELIAGFDAYGKEFARYAELQNETKTLALQWKTIGEDIVGLITRAKEQQVLPGLQAARSAADAKNIMLWSDIDKGLSDDVMSNFLLLRIAAIYYIKDKKQEQWDNFEKAVGTLDTGLKKWLAEVKGNPALEEAGNRIEANVAKYHETGKGFYKVFAEQAKANKEMLVAAETVQKKCTEASAGQHQKMQQQITNADGIIIGASLFAILLGILTALFITVSITKPVAKAVELADAVAVGDLTRSITIDQKDEIGVLGNAMKTMVENLKVMVGVAEKIADGDLTIKVSTLSEKDALGHALKDMVGKLSGVVSEINVSASNVAAGSEQMSSTSQSMSQGATEQASSLEEISSSMNEIASQTKQNAENASQANKLAAEAKVYAEKGNTQMTQMVGAMGEINQSSQSISKIIKVIDEIAFQTNLLALNAAVEAARAGKHGKGFAVVAEEVRNLAARSAKAAKETSEMIEGSVKKVNDGTDIANRTSEALREIVASVGKVTDLVAEIAAASNEQAQGVSQITQGLGQIDQVTQQNTAHAEESASAAEELSSQAMVLQQLISTFKIDEKATSRASAGSPQAGRQQATSRTAISTGRWEQANKPLRASKGNGHDKAPWGGSNTHLEADAPDPVIHLDDKEFGKY
jgi:methyl-accepting chemotaxis protein